MGDDGAPAALGNVLLWGGDSGSVRDVILSSRETDKFVRPLTSLDWN